MLKTRSIHTHIFQNIKRTYIGQHHTLTSLNILCIKHFKERAGAVQSPMLGHRNPIYAIKLINHHWLSLVGHNFKYAFKWAILVINRYI